MQRHFGIVKCFHIVFLCTLAFGTTICASNSKNDTETTTPAKIKCLPSEFACGSICVGPEFLCDGTFQCEDKSDEDHCDLSDCKGADWFKCSNSKCISSKWVCDGLNDCSLEGDGDISDETGCEGEPGTVTKKQSAEMCDPSESFKCKNGICIPKNFFCDGEHDCIDGSDETAGCSELLCAGQFKCKSGECIDLKLKCDSKVDCSDGWSDENACIQSHECLREEGKFLCKSNDKCINGTEVCDKKPDCPDKSDEFPDCEKSCSNKAICPQGCIPDPDLTKPGSCYCFEGFQPSKRDKGKCEDVDECKEFGTCSQVCTNLVGAYECSCINGFKLSKDNSSCQLVDDNASLVFAMHSGVRVLTLGHKKERYYSLAEKMGSPVSIAYNARDDFVYWTDAMENEEAIWQSRINGSEMKIVVSTGLILPEGIAFDWIANNIYFTDSNKSHIVVCSANGAMCSVLIQEQMDKPRDLALHPNLGMMFWTDWGVNPAIIRAGMDGSFPVLIVRDNLRWPNGITVDHGNSRIYWTDAKLDRIETAKLDGDDRRIVKSAGIKHPFGVDVVGDLVFWSDWNLYEIQASNKFDGSRHMTLVKEPFEQLNGLAVVHKANQPVTRRNHCADAGCSHLCTLTPVNSYRCVCPVGMDLSKNRKTCTDNPMWPKFLIAYNNTLKTTRMNSIGRNVFEDLIIPGVNDIGAIAYNPKNNTVILSDLTHRKIFEFDLISKNLSVLVEGGLKFVKGLDIDVVGENLYWVDAEKKTIEVMSLRTRTRITLFREIDRPIDIVVVPEKKMMFLAQMGVRGGKIVRMHMNGFNRKVLARRPNGEPLSLTYNRDMERIYWTDIVGDSIESISIDATSDFIAASRAGAPFGITSYGGRLYWTDLHTQVLHSKRFDLFTEDRPIFIGNYSQLNASSLTPSSSQQGICLAKVTIIQKDLDFVHNLMEKHQCSPKTENKTRCSHMCLLSADDLKGTCVCPETLHLDSSGRNCVPLKTGETVLPVVCSGGRCQSTTTTVRTPTTTKKPRTGSKTVPEKTPEDKSSSKCKNGKCEDGNGNKKVLDVDGWQSLWDFGSSSTDKKSKGKKTGGGDSDRKSRWEDNLEYDDYEGSILPGTANSMNGKRLILNSAEDLEESNRNKVVVSEGSHPLGIVLGVLIFIVLVGVIIGIILHRRNVHPKVLVRPYVQQWVKYVNQPVQRFFENRGEQIDGKKHNVYDEVYHGSESTYSNAGYEEIDAVTDLQGSVNTYAEPADGHRITYSQKDRLIDKEIV